MVAAIDTRAAAIVIGPKPNKLISTPIKLPPQMRPRMASRIQSSALGDVLMGDDDMGIRYSELD